MIMAQHPHQTGIDPMQDQCCCKVAHTGQILNTIGSVSGLHIEAYSSLAHSCECGAVSGRLGAKVLGTSVLEYRFCSTRGYSVLVLFNEYTTYEYFASTSHLKLK